VALSNAFFNPRLFQSTNTIIDVCLLARFNSQLPKLITCLIVNELLTMHLPPEFKYDAGGEENLAIRRWHVIIVMTAAAAWRW
jgi:hypothetical protein